MEPTVKPAPTKPSGIPWLGEVPAHWGVKRLRFSAPLSNERLEADGEDFLPYVGMEHIESWTGQLLPLDDDFIPTGISNRMSAGQVLFGKLRPYLAKAWVADRDGLCSTELMVLNAQQYQPDFLRYIMLSDGFIKLVDSSTQGAKMPRADWEFVGNIALPLPPLPEQRAIAAFLDERTARIDALVARKRRLVQLLKEKRQALITRAVTRGLDPQAKMKESGVPWLGEVPEGWEVKRLKYLLKEPLQYGANEAAEQDDPDQPRFIRITDINEDGGLREETFRSLPEDVARPYLLEEGDVLFARSGATVGKTFLYSTAWGRAAYAGYLIRARLDERCALAKFIHWFTTSTVYWQWLESNTIQATIQNVSADKYNSLWVPVPPLDEQRVIVQTVQSHLTYIAALVTKVEAAVERLQEYRTALISAAVTGKVRMPIGRSEDEMIRQ